MAKRQRVWARKAYEKLILELGGRCAQCGSLSGLSVDHIEEKGYVACKLEWSHRISVYRREAKAGLLQVLCVKCNCKKGKPAPPGFKDGDDDQLSLFTPDNNDDNSADSKPYEWTADENAPF